MLSTFGEITKYQAQSGSRMERLLSSWNCYLGESDCNGSSGIYEMMCRCDERVVKPWKENIHLEGREGRTYISSDKLF
jgi:hypothetical protein